VNFVVVQVGGMRCSSDRGKSRPGRLGLCLANGIKRLLATCRSYRGGRDAVSGDWFLGNCRSPTFSTTTLAFSPGSRLLRFCVWTVVLGGNYVGASVFHGLMG
jgi:hypothetical protein